MNRGIVEIIDEIQDYVDNCKPLAFSSSKISVNRDELDPMLEDLRAKTPEEIRRYKKIISNQEAILQEARNKADSIIAQAQITTNELVSEHQIMQQAYAKANEVVMLATKNAQEVLDNANREANEIRLGAISYADELLRSIETILSGSIETTRTRNETFIANMQEYLNVVLDNRAQLVPPAEEPKPAAKPAAQAPKEEVAEINVPDAFFNKE